MKPLSEAKQNLPASKSIYDLHTPLITNSLI